MRRIAQKKAKARTLETAMRKQIGMRIRERRLAVGLKQKDLGAVIGVSEGQMSRYEKGETPINHAALTILADKLECSFVDLIQGAEK